MAIGKMGKAKAKTHSGYKSPSSRIILRKSLRMPGNSGFIELHGVVKYKALEKSIVLAVSSKKRPDNRAPGIFFREVISPWNRAKNTDGSAVRALDTLLATTARRVSERTFPERSLFLDKCHPSDAGVEKFIETSCAACRSWYCDLSTS